MQAILKKLTKFIPLLIIVFIISLIWLLTVNKYLDGQKQDEVVITDENTLSMNILNSKVRLHFLDEGLTFEKGAKLINLNDNLHDSALMLSFINENNALDLIRDNDYSAVGSKMYFGLDENTYKYVFIFSISPDISCYCLADKYESFYVVLSTIEFTVNDELVRFGTDPLVVNDNIDLIKNPGRDNRPLPRTEDGKIDYAALGLDADAINAIDWANPYDSDQPAPDIEETRDIGDRDIGVGFGDYITGYFVNQYDEGININAKRIKETDTEKQELYSNLLHGYTLIPCQYTFTAYKGILTAYPYIIVPEQNTNNRTEKISETYKYICDNLEDVLSGELITNFDTYDITQNSFIAKTHINDQFCYVIIAKDKVTYNTSYDLGVGVLVIECTGENNEIIDMFLKHYQYSKVGWNISQMYDYEFVIYGYGINGKEAMENGTLWSNMDDLGEDETDYSQWK